MPQPPGRIAGALLVGAACLCWSSGGILVRLLDSAMALLGGSIVLAAAIGLTASEHLPLLPPTAAKQSR
jgi:hypothetical protein